MDNRIHATIRAFVVAASLVAMAAAHAEPSMDQGASPPQPAPTTQYRQLTPHPTTRERVNPGTHARDGDTPHVPPPPPNNNDSSVSYASGAAPRLPPVRTEDLPKNRVKPVDCAVVKAKIHRLQERARTIARVEAALRGATTDYSATNTDDATGFVGAGSPDDALSKLDQELDDIEQLIGKYEKDLKGC
jgi:hypothetical protein